ncbi:MAG: tail fiber domain-containing protein, partial [Bacteroidetes bacterium]|nr:tail fiber domain-containing protein [Bacteroidota bacterium]
LQDHLRVTTGYFTITGGNKFFPTAMFGLGINTQTPTQMLDVNGGNINLKTPTYSYMINNQQFLWHKGGSTNVFLGVGAGNNFPTGVSNSNTFLGANSGFNSNLMSNNSACVGEESGYNNQTSGSSFLGYKSGYSNTLGDFNTFVGTQSGQNNTLGAVNAYLGYKAGQNNNGNENVFAGYQSGIGITSGNFNVIIGSNATSTNVSIQNAIAIGAGATVVNNSQMILGSNSINVGIGLSADPSGPQNKLEIFKGTLSNPLSGLRLRDLAGASPLPSNNQVLSVNPANGDVILTNFPSGTSGLGNVCGASPQNPLTSSWEIPLANNNYIFSGQGTTNNNVGIGTSCTPATKLEILQSSGNTGSTGLLVTNTDVSGGYSSNVNAIGIKAVASNNSNCFPIAGWFEAGTSNAVCRTMAIFIPQSKGIVSIGYSTPSVGMSSGTGILNVNGSADFSGTTYPSDISLKNTVTNIPNSLQQIKRLRSITFKWNNVLDSGMAGTHAGFIAQEVDTVIPQLVKTNPNTGIKSLAYTEIIPYLVKAMQQQQRQIEKQDSIITALTNSITSCCGSSSARSTGYTGSNPRQYNIDLGSGNTVVLSQNVPNPFAEQTTINYKMCLPILKQHKLFLIPPMAAL